MNNNQVEWLMIKKVTAKENRKNIMKLFFQASLFLLSSFAFMIFTFELMVWFWHSSLIEQMAQVLRSWV